MAFMSMPRALVVLWAVGGIVGIVADGLALYMWISSGDDGDGDMFLAVSTQLCYMLWVTEYYRMIEYYTRLDLDPDSEHRRLLLPVSHTPMAVPMTPSPMPYLRL